MKNNYLKILTDIKNAIILLFIIVFFSILGSIIEQDKPINYYIINYPLEIFFFNYQFIFLFGLNHIFKTSWFFFLVCLLSFSLICCTYFQQLPSLDFSRSLNFYKEFPKNSKLEYLKSFKSIYLEKIIKKIRLGNYFIYQKKNVFYCYQGLLGKLGPIFVHLSIILIFIGSLTLALKGIFIEEIIPKSEIFYPQNNIENTLFNFLPQLPLRINDFWINYDKGDFVSQFFTNLSVLNPFGHELLSFTISVNKPLQLNNLIWYQTDWDLLGLRFKIDKFLYEFPFLEIKNQKKLWLSWIPMENTTLNNKGMIFLLENLKGSIRYYDENGQFLSLVDLGEKIKLLNSIAYTPLDILSVTGLQIKNTQGLFITYLGFGFLVFSTLASYLSYSRIWIFKINEKLIRLGGMTNRSKLQFELQLLKFLS